MRYYGIFLFNLKKIRLLEKLTQVELAERASINEKYYGRVERGESSPTLDIIIKLAIALNVNITAFFDEI